MDAQSSIVNQHIRTIGFAQPDKMAEVMYVTIVIILLQSLLTIMYSAKAEEYLKEKGDILNRNDTGKKLRAELDAGKSLSKKIFLTKKHYSFV